MKYGFQKMIAACLALLILLSAVPIAALADDGETLVGWDGTIAEAYESGSGTEDDPYIIVNGAQLAYFASNVENGTTYEGIYFELGADIVLNDTVDWETWGNTDENGYTVAPVNVWDPIGASSSDEWFCGTFDGKGYTVSGVYVNDNKDDNGLFSCLGDGAMLKNLNVAASYVKGDENVGVLVGTIEVYEDAGVISDCSASGNVVARYNAGGIVGNTYIYGSANLTVRDCVNYASVTATNSQAGGIVGYAYGTEILACANNGAVDGGYYTGGIVSELREGLLSACVNHADITAPEYVGGIAFSVRDSDVERCINNGAITCSGDYCAAGITVFAYDSTVSECVNNASITSLQDKAAGVVGNFEGPSEASEQRGYSVITRCMNTGEVVGEYAGGIGSLRYAKASECVNHGNVRATDRAVGAFYSIESSEVSDCYNTGFVAGDVDSWYLSAFAGTVQKSTVTNCYTNGSVIPVNYEYTNVYPFVRSIDDNCTLTGCYYLYRNQTMVDDPLGTFLAEEEAILAESYENYDFLSVWEMGYDEEYAYPTLRFFGSKTYQYRITYQNNGEVHKAETVKAGDPLDLTAPENTSYDFAYWLADDGAHYGVTDTVYATANLTLTAVWIVRNTTPGVWDGGIDTEWEGTGTEADPFLISTPAELAGLSAFTNDPYSYEDLYYYQNAMGAYYKQTADLLINDGGDGFCETLIGRNEWVPVSDNFYGRYNGNGHAIKGVYIRSEAAYVGVFSRAEHIANLTLDDSYVCALSASSVGGIASSASKVENCTNYATVIGDNECIGGVVGNTSNAIDCKNYGYVQGKRSVGGVLGVTNSDEYGIRNCTNYGTVVGKSYVGGVVGNANTTIGCENFGAVYGNEYIGGVAGHAAHIENGINHGDIQNDKANYVGGVAGRGTDITKCVNLGDICGRNCVGGVVGEIGESCADCYSTGTVSALDNAGGIAGGVSWEASIATSYAVGAVNVTDGSNVGGVVGNWYSDATLTDCYYLNTACPSSNEHGTPLSDAQMQTEAVYAGFNFLSVWEMGYDDTYLYPTLRDQGSQEYRYRITYINEGKQIAERVYYNGVKINLTPPASSTYDFAYWKTEDGTRYLSTDDLKASEDLTLIAVWLVPPSGYVWDGRTDTEWAGSGTENDPYLITTVAELVGIAAHMEEVWWDDFEGVYFKQTTDLVVNAGGDQFSDTVIGRFEWQPIDGFSGHYDGDGHSISGVYVNSYTGGAGLFNDFGGSLKNLTLTDSYIVAHNGYAGGLTVELYGTVDNCRNDAYVCSYRNNAGGIVAYVWQDEAVILNSVNSGTVQGVQNVGGIVGDFSGGTVQGCSNSGAVSDLIGIGEQRNVGGIAGNVWYGNVIDCFNSGTVRGKFYIGGIVGYSTAEKLDGCANFGDVIGLSSVGGVVGDNSADITNCYNTGDVRCDVERYGDAENGNYIGGVMGRNDGSLASSVYNTGNVIGNYAHYIGGIVGYDSSDSLQQAYSIGTVTADERSYYVGAAIGSTYDVKDSVYYLDNGTLGDEYSTALAPEQMKTQEAYVGFDFDVHWSIDPTSEEYPYPVLLGAPHKQYVTVTFVDQNGGIIETQRLEKNTAIVYPDMTTYNFEDDTYVYEFDAWNRTPLSAWEDMTITASFKKVAKLFFTSVHKEITVGYGYSRDNLQVDLESLFGEVICTTTTDYRLLSRVTWDMHNYDPAVAGDVEIVGYAVLTESPYYAMAEGATVSVTVTVLPEGDTSHEFTVNDLTYQQQPDGTLAVTGYQGDAQVIHIPSTIDKKTVSTIAENAFANSHVISVILPPTVKTVEASAFENAVDLSVVALPDGVQTVGDHAFYNTALADITCPESLTAIGEEAFGYYGDTPTAVSGFTVYAFADSDAESYAKAHGFVCVSAQTAVDADSQIAAVIPENLTLAVAQVEEDSYHDTAAGIFTETDAVQLMDISLYDGDVSTQPGGVMTVSVPIPAGFDASDCHIFRINADGSYKDMKAEIVDGYLIFSTAHLSVYAVVEQHADSVMIGDMTGDGTLNMRDALLLYQVASNKTPNPVSIEVADVTGDGHVNMRDVLKLYQITSSK